MFGFKKTSVLELLNGMTDIHCHLLPGIDDGAKDVDSAIELIRRYKAMGFAGAIATPHILKGAYPNTAETIATSYNELHNALEAQHIEFDLHYAAEHMLDEDVAKMIENKAMLPLAGNYILIEMSYAQKPVSLNNTLFNISMKGYQPILAHPERYTFFRELDHYRDLKKRSCFFQLNVLSLSDHYGSEVKKKTQMLLKEGHYDFIGTDTHHQKHLDLLQELMVKGKYQKELERIIENTKKLTSQLAG